MDNNFSSKEIKYGVAGYYLAQNKDGEYVVIVSFNKRLEASDLKFFYWELKKDGYPDWMKDFEGCIPIIADQDTNNLIGFHKIEPLTLAVIDRIKKETEQYEKETIVAHNEFMEQTRQAEQLMEESDIIISLSPVNSTANFDITNISNW